MTDDRTTPSIEALIERAKGKYQTTWDEDHQIEIETTNPETSEADDGAWVKAWVWVPYKECEPDHESI